VNRRSIPEYEMNNAGAVHLRQQGILVMRFMDSLRNDPRRLQPHFHEFFQVCLLLAPTTVMLDFQNFRTRGPAVLFISPGQVHTIRPKPGLQGVTVSFTQAFFDDETPPPSRLLELPFFFPDDRQPWLRLAPQEITETATIFGDLCDEYDRALSDAVGILRATLRLALLRLARIYARTSPPRKATRGISIVRQFHLELEKHFREETNLSTYASRLGVTPNHLNDVVHEQTGHSAGELIRRRRLLDAKRMLSHSQLSVSEIGYSLGFEDPSYFARFFRRYEGITPTAFLEQFREKYQ
jgi:AraC-like DNA-binding protein